MEKCQQHVWICDGKCGKQPPYYGIVKRANNSPPGEKDWWFKKHQQTCGGTFLKVAEPKSQTQTLDNFFKKRKMPEESKKEEIPLVKPARPVKKVPKVPKEESKEEDLFSLSASSSLAELEQAILLSLLPPDRPN